MEGLALLGPPALACILSIWATLRAEKAIREPAAAREELRSTFQAMADLRAEWERERASLANLADEVETIFERAEQKRKAAAAKVSQLERMQQGGAENGAAPTSRAEQLKLIRERTGVWT